jgi:hypothetical protein
MRNNACKRSAPLRCAGVYAEPRPAIESELSRVAEAAIATCRAAAAAMDALRDLQREDARLAMACRTRPVAPALDDPTMTAFGVEQWAARVRSILDPPAPKPIARASDNPLVLVKA